ncbi:hypothetical protein CBR_g38929 [Chara braunii]|uniref:Uncharacterized protein n=1 Tax=Chara braunii TaxID=69332 RepID=A0A388K0Q4_CHABU|nr:hypothetical protein CBR_g38929 [Chara braunii]|eukprot:GBG63618.1 hypothetical protein CBR_g38929 [Chara braunii]
MWRCPLPNVPPPSVCCLPELLKLHFLYANDPLYKLLVYFLEDSLRDTWLLPLRLAVPMLFVPSWHILQQQGWREGDGNMGVL